MQKYPPVGPVMLSEAAKKQAEWGVKGGGKMCSCHLEGVASGLVSRSSTRQHSRPSHLL